MKLEKSFRTRRELYYLGTIIEEYRTINKEINDRIEKTSRIYNALNLTFLGRREKPKNIKTKVYKKVVKPALIYGSESWTLTNRSKSKIPNEILKKSRRSNKNRHRVRNAVITSRQLNMCKIY